MNEMAAFGRKISPNNVCYVMLITNEKFIFELRRRNNIFAQNNTNNCFCYFKIKQILQPLYTVQIEYTAKHFAFV